MLAKRITEPPGSLGMDCCQVPSWLRSQLYGLCDSLQEEGWMPGIN